MRNPDPDNELNKARKGRAQTSTSKLRHETNAKHTVAETTGAAPPHDGAAVIAHEIAGGCVSTRWKMLVHVDCKPEAAEVAVHVTAMLLFAMLSAMVTEPSAFSTQPSALAGHEHTTRGGAGEQASEPCKQSKQSSSQRSKAKVFKNFRTQTRYNQMRNDWSQRRLRSKLESTHANRVRMKKSLSRVDRATESE